MVFLLKNQKSVGFDYFFPTVFDPSLYFKLYLPRQQNDALMLP